MENDFISPKSKNKGTLKGAHTTRNRNVGITLTIIGFMLFILGVIILLVKGNSTLTIISLPVIFLGLIIWHGSKKGSSTTE